jgi:hypothetical protein
MSDAVAQVQMMVNQPFQFYELNGSLYSPFLSHFQWMSLQFSRT